MVDDLMHLSGFRELAAAMRELPERVARNTLRRATSSAAAIIRNEARAKAPVDTGEMRRDIQIKRERDTKGEMSAKYSVFVRSGKKSRLSGKSRDVQKDSYYWRFVEFGTAKMAAQPFMRPAFETKKEAAVAQIGAALDAGIQKAARELAKK
ncbi:MAG TPA: HK97-gp10 family putative phage morphogenesis protein [Noviherbaspirillum sp.]|nr:HK97-gp10 family putative phage morphogenesis protein [Noviherbaspirillum sp.]